MCSDINIIRLESNIYSEFGELCTGKDENGGLRGNFTFIINNRGNTNYGICMFVDFFRLSIVKCVTLKNTQLLSVHMCI